MKRQAYGMRNFDNFRDRVLVQCGSVEAEEESSANRVEPRIQDLQPRRDSRLAQLSWFDPRLHVASKKGPGNQ